jgi:hypothetical protein
MIGRLEFVGLLAGEEPEPAVALAAWRLERGPGAGVGHRLDPALRVERDLPAPVALRRPAEEGQLVRLQNEEVLAERGKQLQPLSKVTLKQIIKI